MEEANDVAIRVGEILKNRRRSLCVRQSDLAELAGVSLRTLIAIERGEANPSLDNLSKIATALGLEVSLATKNQ